MDVLPGLSCPSVPMAGKNESDLLEEENGSGATIANVDPAPTDIFADDIGSPYDSVEPKSRPWPLEETPWVTELLVADEDERERSKTLARDPLFLPRSAVFEPRSRRDPLTSRRVIVALKEPTPSSAIGGTTNENELVVAPEDLLEDVRDDRFEDPPSVDMESRGIRLSPPEDEEIERAESALPRLFLPLIFSALGLAVSLRCGEANLIVGKGLLSSSSKDVRLSVRGRGRTA